MLTHDDALARVRAWFDRRPQPPGVETQVRVREFDGVWLGFQHELRPDPAQPPQLVGGPQIVVDGETGQIFPFGSQPPASVAREYAAVDAGDGRFPLDVARVLHFKGWRPGRDVSEQVESWITGRLDGLTPSPAARALLNEFGGLWLQRFDSSGVLGGGSSSYFYPDVRGRLYLDLIRRFEVPEVFPVGWVEDDESELVMDPSGRVFSLHWADSFLVGSDPDSAIVNLVRSDRWSPAGL